VRASAEGPGGALLTAGPEAAPLGFALIRVSADEAELLTIAVHPAAQRRGLGRALLLDCGRRALEFGAATLFLEVAADNAPAQALYARSGFTQVGRRPRYYRRGGGACDALILRRELGETG
jgi:ribosomal-protein-alanine N-acetyltransferase